MDRQTERDRERQTDRERQQVIEIKKIESLFLNNVKLRFQIAIHM